MKKVMMSLAIVAMMVATVACGNNKKADEQPAEVTETVEEAVDTTANGQVDTTVVVDESVEVK